jgi:hypothetical protein
MTTANTSCMPVLSFLAAGHYGFNFVGEGAANVVFQVVAQPGDEHSSIFQGETETSVILHIGQTF